MRYEILGPVGISVNNEKFSAGTLKMEVLLRTLLIRNGQVVSIDQLMRELWGDSPPARAIATLHVYVSQLRKVINRLSGKDDVIVTRAPGYLLNLGSDELDLDLFLARSEKGRQQIGAGEFAAAARTLAGALELWRGSGQPSSYDGPIMREFAGWVEELRVDCMELLAHAQLASDQASAAVRVLNPLTSEYPLRENLYAFLMEALSQAGRRADALEVYRTARTRLRGELGLEPCRLLQETQECILNDRLDELSIRRVAATQEAAGAASARPQATPGAAPAHSVK